MRSALTLPLSSVMFPVCSLGSSIFLKLVYLRVCLSCSHQRSFIVLIWGGDFFLTSVLFAPSLIFIISSITEDLAFTSPIFFSFWAWWQVFQHFLLFFCASTDSLLVIHPPYFSVGCMCRQVYSSVFLSVFLDSEVRCAVSMSLCSFQSWIFFLPDFQLSCIVVGKDTWFDYSF